MKNEEVAVLRRPLPIRSSKHHIKRNFDDLNGISLLLKVAESQSAIKNAESIVMKNPEPSPEIKKMRNNSVSIFPLIVHRIRIMTYRKLRIMLQILINSSFISQYSRMFLG